MRSSVSLEAMVGQMPIERKIDEYALCIDNKPRDYENVPLLASSCT